MLNSNLTAMNAANLTPASIPVIDRLHRNMLDLERDPSPASRMKTSEQVEVCRERIAAFLHADPEDIIITRNASEANNLVSSGIELKAGDEVIIYSDNHPSNNAAWYEKSKRHGFTIDVLNQLNPHPGAAYYVESFIRRMNAKTRLLALTHVTGQVGDLLPVRDLVRAARERGVLTLVDGAQSFGVIPVDLSDMQPDFFSASAHKWACGPKGVGLLYINRAVQSKIRPSIVSSRPGRVGISRTLEAFGQRDDAAIGAFGEALSLHTRIGGHAIEVRARELAQMLMEGLKRLDGVHMWTHASTERSAAIVSFRAGELDPTKLSGILYQNYGIVCASRSGADRPGLRFSPHLYNSPEEVERVVSTIKDVMNAGL